MSIDRRFSVAPMMAWTDRHCRYFHRLLSPSALLYTEMVTTPAMLHGDLERLIGFNPAEQPLALQLGGSNPQELARCARIAEQRGFQEVNLNCGCPSDRVQSGTFGACLMAQPRLVADCVKAMQEACSLEITVKNRIGIDDQDGQQSLSVFIDTIAQAGCKTFIVHARKAWLKGLSPKENRDIPPLDYERVYVLKDEFPQLNFVLNGGINSIGQALTVQGGLEGVMLGRAAYQEPYVLLEAEEKIFQGAKAERSDILALLEQMQDYAARMKVEQGTPLKSITRHMLGLFNGQKGARQWRRILSTEAQLENACPSLITKAAQLVFQLNA